MESGIRPAKSCLREYTGAPLARRASQVNTFAFAEDLTFWSVRFCFSLWPGLVSRSLAAVGGIWSRFQRGLLLRRRRVDGALHLLKLEVPLMQLEATGCISS